MEWILTLGMLAFTCGMVGSKEIIGRILWKESGIVAMLVMAGGTLAKWVGGG